MRARLAGLGILLVAAGVALAADDYPILVYPCPLAKQPPTIDGKLDEACWSGSDAQGQEAPLVSGFTFYNKQQLVDVQTAFRLLHDDKALYVGVRCEEPLAKRLTQSPPSFRDDHPGVFGGEAIELFLDPFHDHANYYQIAVSLNGTLFDGKGTDTTWNSDTKVAVTLSEDCWTVEMAIPWADFELTTIKPGTLLGFNLCRDRNVNEARQWTCWSQIEANFHDPQRFGHVVLGGSADDLGRLAQALRLGERKGQVRIFGAGGFSQTSYVALARESIKQLDTVLEELEATGAKEESPAVRDALQKKLDAARQQVAPLRVKLNTASTIDASEWLKAESTVNKLSEELRTCLWQVRLEALLAEI